MHTKVALLVTGTGVSQRRFYRMSKRILVVEDQPDNRQIIRDMLAPTDYEITEAENGEEALAAIAKQRPDLILMDIQLPTMDGYTATSRIKSDPKLPPRMPKRVAAADDMPTAAQFCEPENLQKYLH
jgi:two-component system, NarL family, sensor histidine kinase EvgS